MIPNSISSLETKVTEMRRFRSILVHTLLLPQHLRHELLQSKCKNSIENKKRITFPHRCHLSKISSFTRYLLGIKRPLPFPNFIKTFSLFIHSSSSNIVTFLLTSS